MRKAARWKLAVAIAVALALCVVILQNTDPVDTRILFMTVTMPRAALLGLTALAGFVLGLVAAYSLVQRPRE